MSDYFPWYDIGKSIYDGASDLYDRGSAYLSGVYNDTTAYLSDLHGRIQQDGLIPTMLNEYYHSGIPQGQLELTDYLLGTDLSGRFNFDDIYVPSVLDHLADKGLDDLGGLLDKKGTPKPPSPSPPRQNMFDYLEAELAKFYGMDRNTAYQEALSNTAYQRAVRDMQRAGLNPAAIFGSGRGQGAQGVAYVSSGGSSYSGSAKDAKLFSSEDFGFIASLAGLATAVATKNPSNFWLGQQGAQAVMQVLNGLDRKFK